MTNQLITNRFLIACSLMSLISSISYVWTLSGAGSGGIVVSLWVEELDFELPWSLFLIPCPFPLP